MKPTYLYLPKNYINEVMSSLDVPQKDYLDFLKECTAQYYSATSFLSAGGDLIGFRKDGSKVTFAMPGYADNLSDVYIQEEKENRIEEQGGLFPLFNSFSRRSGPTYKISVPPEVTKAIIKHINQMKSDSQLSDTDKKAVPYMERFMMNAIRFYAMIKKQAEAGYDLRFEHSHKMSDSILTVPEKKGPAQVFTFELKPVMRFDDDTAEKGTVIRLDDFRHDPS